MSERSYYVFVCKWRGKIMNKRKRLLAILINGMLLSSLCVASAADVTAGGGEWVRGIRYLIGLAVVLTIRKILQSVTRQRLKTMLVKMVA